MGDIPKDRGKNFGAVEACNKLLRKHTYTEPVGGGDLLARGAMRTHEHLSWPFYRVPLVGCVRSIGADPGAYRQSGPGRRVR